MKTIVAHVSIDLDAITSAWQLVRYLPGWRSPTFKFVPAGKTLDNKPADADPNVLHVDTGLGKFDHHQFSSDKLSATKRVFDHLLKNGYVNKKDEKALSKIVDFVTLIDHFGEVYFPNPSADLYDFSLYRLTEGLKSVGKSDEEIMHYVFTALDATLELFKKKINAEQEVKKGFVFESRWGKALAMESQNEETMKMALKNGYRVVVRRNPKNNYIRIKTLPEKDIDLTPAHKEIIKIDPQATWFLHAGKHMLLNGSSKSPDAKPSSLSLKKVIEILQ